MANAPKTRSNAASDRDRARRIRKLERRLSAARDLEEKRRGQVGKAGGGDGHQKLAAKRQRQLEKAHGKSAALADELASLGGAAPATPAAAPAAAAPAAAESPQGYCLREKRTVTIANPQPFVMRNGRTATAGTCPSCGSRIVRP